jgi:hypothetical protein
VEQAEYVVEACSKLDAQHPALRTMLVVLGIREHVELQY